jgi:iron(II)-dependent oxidoreductase
MILIPAGEFLMGTTDAEAKRIIQQYGKDWEAYVRWEQPQHTVYLDTFYISRYPVTNAEYKKFKADWEIPNGKEKHPVVNVSWNDAAAYCEWAGGRLPTEAEWEKAASWDDAKKIKRIYPWEGAFDKNKCNTSESGIRDTTPVGKYSPMGDSFYGVGDMAGNVWEWCADWYDENYYQNSPRENPRNDTPGQYRVLRGAAFFDAAVNARCAFRVGFFPGDRFVLIGFRVAVPPA